MNLFIQQTNLSKLKLAYTIATSYDDGYQRIEAYLALAKKPIESVTIYHSEITTNKSTVVFVYTEAIDNIDDYNKNEIQMLEADEGDYLTFKVGREFYKDILFKNKELQKQFNQEIKEYCRLHNLKQHMPGFPYLAVSVNEKEQLFFPVKKV
jgi:hypothetical protein